MKEATQTEKIDPGMPAKETLVFKAQSKEVALQDERVQKLKRDGWKVVAVHELASFWATFLKVNESTSKIKFLIQLEKSKNTSPS